MPEPMDAPEPSISIPLLECSLDTMRHENSIAVVHEQLAIRLELLLPSPQEQVDMSKILAEGDTNLFDV